MQISIETVERICDEQEIIERLPLDGARVLELGCDKAENTRKLAESGRVAAILALEVDTSEHDKYLEINGLPKVRFGLGGAEAIPVDSGSFDIVFMFKSLHHVPVTLMDQALEEIRRVRAPGGLAYLSEPVFAGDYNEILRLFHDEQAVRAAAFAAIRRCVDAGRMELADELFFNTRLRYREFADFEEKVLRVTHTDHRLSPEMYDKVRARFHSHMSKDGAQFLIPMRVDLLRFSA